MLAKARHLRREMTDAEQRLWYWLWLRGGRFNGLKFRRQHPVPPHVAGFACVQHRLIIKLDGSQHNQQKDARRDAYLKAGMAIVEISKQYGIE